jgi:hypothetical protein
MESWINLAASSAFLLDTQAFRVAEKISVSAVFQAKPTAAKNRGQQPGVWVFFVRRTAVLFFQEAEI